MDACKFNLHHFDINSTHNFEFESCQRCFTCVEYCFSKALVKVGELISTDKIMGEILEQKPYFDNSNGGVTFSGGESMLQIEALVDLLKKCKENQIHTTIDTAGNVNFAQFEKVMPYTDLFLYDIKAINNELHKKETGASNEKILANFRRLISQGANVHVKIPYIPHHNDEEMENIAEFLKDYDVRKSLIPYHEFGEVKYTALGKRGIEQPSISKDNEELNNIKQRYKFE